MLTIEFTANARKQLKRLALTDQRRISDFLLERAASHENPLALAKRLTVPDDELWRFRIGDFRIIARFVGQKLEITVISVGHRREIYR
jgi:mRNA interferase RelE/StbE